MIDIIDIPSFARGDVLVKNTITGEHAENTLKVFRICGRENTGENLGDSEWRV
ncbi:hypothetical protein Hanom_Chr15g01387141 [Helianthus anomalus]